METLLFVSQSLGFVLSALVFVVFTCWMCSEDLIELIQALPLDLEGEAFGVVGHRSLASESVQASSVQTASTLAHVKAHAAYSEALGYSEAFDRAALSPEYLAAWERVEHDRDIKAMDDLTVYLLALYPSDADRRPYHLN